MKTLAYYPLHYGKEYLDVSLQSIHPYVDKIVILYSPIPTFGFPSTLGCPDTEEELRAIAMRYDKVEWIPVWASNESEHRKLIDILTPGFDLLLAVDADEVWLPESLCECLQTAYAGEYGRYNILGFIHFWKSFGYIVADSFAPGRIYNLHNPPERETAIWGKVYHFGYTQSLDITEYKIAIHGHHSEIRSEWLELFRNWKPEDTDLHPTSYGVWPKAMPFDKNQLPEFLKQHPNFNKI